MKKILLSLFLSIGSLLYMHAQVVLSGVVHDKTDGKPLPGVSIIIKGTNSGTLSNADGTFRIEMPSDTGTLLARMVGYTTNENQFKGPSVFNIDLTTDSVNLNEVVIIGYGETRKKDLSTAVTTLDLASQKSRPTSAIGMLQGQMPGVSVSSDGGDPLAETTIVVRGKGSRYEDEILYVVDGVAGAPFNTEDVESITVLKDAASAAIYGAHVGSGGVFIVTTKKAHAGKAKISANVYHGVQSAWKIPHALTAEEYNMVTRDAATAGNGTIPGVVDSATYPYGQTTRTDWTSKIFRVAKIDHYAVSISGGSENLKAFGSFEYDNKEGILLNTYARNLGAKLDVEYKVNKKLTVSETANFKYSNGQGDINTYSHTGVIIAAMFMPSSAPVYEDDGSYCGTVPEKYSDLGIAGGYGEVQNPVATLLRLDQYRPEQTIFSTSALTYKPFTFLTLKSSLSARNKQSRYQDFVSKVTEIGKTNLTNSRTMQSSWGNYWLWENTATFSHTFALKHNVNAVFGYSEGKENYRYFDLTAYGFGNESTSTRSLDNATDWSTTSPSETFWEDAQISSFGRLSYSFDDRYFATLSCRYDATSKLPKAHNSGIFPAASAAWKLSSEPFFTNKIDAISLVKFRASWGQIGNVAAVDHYAGNVALSDDAAVTYLGNNAQTQISGVGLNTLANPDLKWETSQQTDFGADLAFFKDHLNLSVDYFIKKTINMIDELNEPSVAGVATNPLGNVGNTKNTGLELTLDYNGKIGKVGFNVGANFTSLKNLVTSLKGEEYIAHTDEIRGLTMLRSTVGQPWHSFYVVQADGIFQDQTQINNYTFNGTLIQPNAKPGDLKFKDVSGPEGTPDGIINDYDKVYSGSYAPKETYGFHLGFDYKGFDLGAQFQGIAGNKIFNGFKLMTMEGTQGWNMSKDILNSWTYNKSSDIARVTNSDENKNYGTASTYFIQDGSYLRLKNITLGYTLPKSILSKIKFDGATLRVYCSSENVFTWTKYKGMDPEVGNNGVDGGRYPVSRMFNVGANVNF
jgi:TonB-linked SusC/RagA family outer membrane protein